MWKRGLVIVVVVVIVIIIVIIIVAASIIIVAVVAVVVAVIVAVIVAVVSATVIAVVITVVAVVVTVAIRVGVVVHVGVIIPVFVSIVVGIIIARAFDTRDHNRTIRLDFRPNNNGIANIEGPVLHNGGGYGHQLPGNHPLIVIHGFDNACEFHKYGLYSGRRHGRRGDGAAARAQKYGNHHCQKG